MLYWQFRLIGKSESVVCGKSSYLKDLSLFSKKLQCNNKTYLSIHKYYSDIKIYLSSYHHYITLYLTILCPKDCYDWYDNVNNIGWFFPQVPPNNDGVFKFKTNHTP